MSRWYLVFMFGFTSLFATSEKTPSASDAKITPPRIAAYLNLYKQFSQTLGPAGSWKDGEIEIALDPAKIKEIESKCKQNLMVKKGMDEAEAEKWSRVGIIADDGYWMWIRDAVTFPSGAAGTYNRILWKSSLQAPPGVAVLPVLPNKKVILNLNYRHATRSWELEVPRGARKDGETLEQTAIRELKEETGYHIDKAIFLGKMATDSGLSTSLVPIFLAQVSKQESPEQDDSEAIQEILSFSKEEIKQGLVRGYIEVDIRGQMVKVPCRDSFLSFALVLAEGKGSL